MKKLTTLIAVLMLALGTALFAAPDDADAVMSTTEQALAERVLGDPEAPITIIAFESLTCPHCASFHRDAFPKIKENYIDTGKAKLVYSDFPLNQRAVVASMMARCAVEERFFPLIEMLFKTQSQWNNAPQPLEELAKIGRLGGLSDEEFDACLSNDELFEGLRAQQNEATEKYDIHSTPTFIINGEKIQGAQPYETFDEVLRSMVD